MALSDYQRAGGNVTSALNSIGYLGTMTDRVKSLASDGGFIDWAKTVKGGIGATNRLFATADGLEKAYQAYQAGLAAGQTVGESANAAISAFNSGKGLVSSTSMMGKAMPWLGRGLFAYDLITGNTSDATPASAMAATGVIPFAGPFALGVGLSEALTAPHMNWVEAKDINGYDSTRYADGSFRIMRPGDNNLNDGVATFKYDANTNQFYANRYLPDSANMTPINDYSSSAAKANSAPSWHPMKIVQHNGKNYLLDPDQPYYAYNIDAVGGLIANTKKQANYTPYDPGMVEEQNKDFPEYSQRSYTNTPTIETFDMGTSTWNITLNKDWERRGDDAYQPSTGQYVERYFVNDIYDDIPKTTAEGYTPEISSYKFNPADVGATPATPDQSSGETDMTPTQIKADAEAYLQAHPGDYEGWLAQVGITPEDQINMNNSGGDSPITDNSGDAATQSSPSLANSNLMTQVETELGLPAGSFATYATQYNDELSNAIRQLGQVSTQSIPYQGMNLVPKGAIAAARGRVNSLAQLANPNEISAKIAANADNVDRQGQWRLQLQQDKQAANDPGLAGDIAQWLTLGRVLNQATGGAANDWFKAATKMLFHKGDSTSSSDVSSDPSLDLPDRWWDMSDNDFNSFIDNSNNNWLGGGNTSGVVGNLDPGNYDIGGYSGDASGFGDYQPPDINLANTGDYGNLNFNIPGSSEYDQYMF